MAIDIAASRFIDSLDAPAASVVPAAPVRPELLVCALLHLMSQYHAGAPDGGACVKLASVIERQFQALARLPDATPALRATCARLAEQWEAVVERSMPHAGRQDRPPRPVQLRQAR